jgi:hypothetical protein
LEILVNKRYLVFLAVLASLALTMSSCLFDSEDSALSSWLSDQGMPDTYKVQTLSIGDLTPLSAEVFLDSTPRGANDRALF